MERSMVEAEGEQEHQTSNVQCPTPDVQRPTFNVKKCGLWKKALRRCHLHEITRQNSAFSRIFDKFAFLRAMNNYLILMGLCI
jgi:hypothetical protein